VCTINSPSEAATKRQLETTRQTVDDNQIADRECFKFNNTTAQTVNNEMAKIQNNVSNRCTDTLGYTRTAIDIHNNS